MPRLGYNPVPQTIIIVPKNPYDDTDQPHYEDKYEAPSLAQHRRRPIITLFPACWPHPRLPCQVSAAQKTSWLTRQRKSPFILCHFVFHDVMLPNRDGLSQTCGPGEVVTNQCKVKHSSKPWSSFVVMSNCIHLPVVLSSFQARNKMRRKTRVPFFSPFFVLLLKCRLSQVTCHFGDC